MINDSGAEYIIERLEALGYSAFYVGGCVRNALLNEPIYDYDLCTSATPDQIIQAFKRLKYLTVGVKHGTVTLIINDTPYEITTFRTEELYSDFRHPDSVVFTADIHQDLKRRDFTINSLAYNKTLGIIDDFGGVYDTHNRLLRAVGDANKRFNEDALRILRGMRFASTYNLKIVDETKNAMIFNAPLLLAVSAERIYSEFNKLILGESACLILSQFVVILQTLFPEIIYNDKFESCLKAISLMPNDCALRYATLFLNCKEQFTQIAKRYKFDNKTANKIKLMHANYHLDLISISTRAQVKKLMRYLQSDFLDYVNWRYLLALTFGEEQLANKAKDIIEIYNSVINSGECYTLKQLALNGNDLVALGITGNNVKILLDKALSAVITQEIGNAKKEIIDYLGLNG